MNHPPARWLVRSWQFGGSLDLLLALLLVLPSGRHLLEQLMTRLHIELGATGPLPLLPTSAGDQLFLFGFAIVVAALGVSLLAAARKATERAWFPPLDGGARLAFSLLIILGVSGRDLSPSLLSVAGMDFAFGLTYICGPRLTALPE